MVRYIIEFFYKFLDIIILAKILMSTFLTHTIYFFLFLNNTPS